MLRGRRPWRARENDGVAVQGRAGRKMGCCFALACVAALAGCGENPSAPRASADQATEAGSAFDPSTAGAVGGMVKWAGDIPTAPPFRAPVSPLPEEAIGPKREWPNLNAPRIDPQTRSVGNAVVFLRGVDSRRARPWNHGPARVEMRDYQIHVRQGDADGPIGFVRRGDAVTLDGEQGVFQCIQGRGANFFALTLPAGCASRDRVLDRCGVVELSSSAGQFWMRAYLFVDDHPYFARTAADGRYTLPQAPPGDYDLVCWMPDWREASHEIDGDSRLVCRLTFRPPLEVKQRVHIEAGATATAEFTLSVDQFDAKPTGP